MPETITIDIMLDDLCEEKQAQIMEAFRCGYKEGNFDVFPVAQIIVSEDE
jgi:hypothetical protein